MNSNAHDKFIKCLDACVTDFANRHNLTRCKVQTSGFATFVLYDGEYYSVAFIYGPPEYRVEVAVRLKKQSQKYDLNGLMDIPSINEWVFGHKLSTDECDKMFAETKWYVALLDFALPKLREI